jgi:hypothetical protein
MRQLLGYARVSSADQQPHLQVDALQRAGCYRVFTETASGARTDRPMHSARSWMAACTAPLTPPPTSSSTSPLVKPLSGPAR